MEVGVSSHSSLAKNGEERTDFPVDLQELVESRRGCNSTTSSFGHLGTICTMMGGAISTQKKSTNAAIPTLAPSLASSTNVAVGGASLEVGRGSM